MGQSARSVRPTVDSQSWAGNALRSPTGRREGFVSLAATLARNAPYEALPGTEGWRGHSPGPGPSPHSAALGPTPGPTSFLILSRGHSLSPAQPGALPPMHPGVPCLPVCASVPWQRLLRTTPVPIRYLGKSMGACV